MEQYFDKSIFHFGTAKVVHKHNKFFLHISVNYNSEKLKDTDVYNVAGHDRRIRFSPSSYQKGYSCEYPFFYSDNTDISVHYVKVTVKYAN